ncbi:MAG: hypothetical protein ACI8TQ_003767 [Planctomycetota bacterium]|jgi:hypothetical protein
MVRLDPGSGEQIAVEFSGVRQRELNLFFHTQRVPLSAVESSTLGYCENIAVFDPVRNQFRWIPTGDYTYVKQVETDSVLILDEHLGLKRINVRSGERVTIFP